MSLYFGEPSILSEVCMRNILVVVQKQHILAFSSMYVFRACMGAEIWAENLCVQFCGMERFFVYGEIAQNTRPIVRTLHMSKKSSVFSA